MLTCMNLVIFLLKKLKGEGMMKAKVSVLRFLFARHICCGNFFLKIWCQLLHHMYGRRSIVFVLALWTKQRSSSLEMLPYSSIFIFICNNYNLENIVFLDLGDMMPVSLLESTSSYTMASFVVLPPQESVQSRHLLEQGIIYTLPLSNVSTSL